MAKKLRRKKKRKFTPESREAFKYKNHIRTTFKNCGFEQFPTRNNPIQIADRDGDIDALFAYENIVALRVRLVSHETKVSNCVTCLILCQSRITRLA